MPDIIWPTVLVTVSSDGATLAAAAAANAAARLRAALKERQRARIIAATGASQFEFLGRLVREDGIDWRRVEMFHLDEYIGLPIDHPASFRKYLLERLIRPAGILDYHLLDGEGDPAVVARSVGDALRKAPIDVAFVGIGENGHLAFNDPPADFVTESPYLIVRLDDACRRQQVGEGWFASITDVPETAISMSVRQILAANAILCVVPDRRKAETVRACLEGPVTPNAPASILRTHRDVTIYLDPDSASLLSRDLVSRGSAPVAEDLWRVPTVGESS
jgi:glucosamine-6-phosphate deaminase